MFILGVWLLDASKAPGLYLLYWLVMMVLVAWVCALAVKDVLHTRRLVSQWRMEQERDRRRMYGASARREPVDAPS